MSLALGYAFEDSSKLTQSSFIVGVSLSQKGGATTLKLKPTWSFNVIVGLITPEHRDVVGLPPQKDFDPGGGHGERLHSDLRHLEAGRFCLAFQV